MTYVYRDQTLDRIRKVIEDTPEFAAGLRSPDESPNASRPRNRAPYSKIADYADEVARTLVDKDVAAGEYEGCSTELELAYIDYEAQARNELERRQRVAAQPNEGGGR